MIGCLRPRVRKQPIIALYFESETVLKFYYLNARRVYDLCVCIIWQEHPKAKRKVFLEKRGIKPVTPGLQGIALIHYNVAASMHRLLEK